MEPGLRWVWSAVLLGWTGCGPGSFVNCEDSACRASTVKLGYLDDPAGVLEYVKADADPLEQAALVELLAHEYPDDSALFCGTVSAGSVAGERCRRLQLRPHLYARFADSPVENVSAGEARAAPWPAPDVEKLRGRCAAKDIPCLSDLSYTQGEAGNMVEAGQLCTLAWPAGSKSRAECIFQAAEKAAMAMGPRGTAIVVPSCLQTESFAGNCIQHVVVLLQPSPPPADEADAESVAAIRAQVVELRAALDAQDSLGAIDYAWAVWTRDAYRQATQVNGSLLGALPAEAEPHVRAAAALRLSELSPVPPADLEVAAGAVKAALEVRPGLLEHPIGAPRYRPEDRLGGEQPHQYWVADSTKAEAALDSISCFGAGRRTVGGNELDEYRIVAMEAAARRKSPPGPAFFASVVTSGEEERVRWTAARFLGELYPHLALKLSAQQTSPLVKAALTRIREGALPEGAP